MKVITRSSIPSARMILAGLTLTLLSTGVLLAGTQSALAQTGSSSDLAAPVGSSDRDSPSNGEFGSVGNMFDLFHRAQQGAIADPYAFGRSQQQNLNTAAETFRQRQLQLLQQQRQPGTTPAAAPQIVAPGQSVAPAPAAAPSQLGTP